MTDEIDDKPKFPPAQFIEDLDDFLKDVTDVDSVLKKLQEDHSKYKYMEVQLMKQKAALKGKIPDIEKTLEMVKHLKTQHDAGEEVSTWFELADNVQANAKITNPNSVCLWLGANVMLEYTCDEAIALLTKNLAAATQNMETLDNDLYFLRDQAVITEVNIARVFNHDVKRRRQAAPAASS
eukprot:tig00020909_g15357.t1